MPEMRKTIFAIAFAIVLSFVSCSRFSKPKAPKPLFDENRMVEIITDAYLIEAKLNFANERGGSADSLKDSYFQQLYEHHGITKEQFSENMRYYTQKPDVLEEIMSRVTDTLTQKQIPVKDIP